MYAIDVVSVSWECAVVKGDVKADDGSAPNALTTL
jgi:hypothetical protein